MSLKSSAGRIVIQVDMQKKNSHRFEDGTTIHLARGYNNFNLRQINPVNGVVMASERVPKGTEVLVQYNAIQETFQILNFKPLSGKHIAEDVKYYSIPEEMCYAYLDGKEWKPFKNFAFGLRVFRPYSGPLQGIEPTKIKDTLYVTTGELKGNVVRTLKACDYSIVFQDTNGQEGNIIVFEHYEGEDNDREHVILVNHDLTEELNEGKLLIGITKTDAVSLEDYHTNIKIKQMTGGANMILGNRIDVDKL